MNFRSFWNNSDVAFVLKMVLIALAIVIVLGVAALFWLDKYTHHGDEVVVPNVVNSYVEEASILAQAEGLHLVIADTTYTRRFKLGSIVEQNPAPDSRTKRGGTLYVIVNVVLLLFSLVFNRHNIGIATFINLCLLIPVWQSAVNSQLRFKLAQTEQELKDFVGASMARHGCFAVQKPRLERACAVRDVRP